MRGPVLIGMGGSLYSGIYKNGQIAENMLKDGNNAPEKLVRYFESGAKYEEIEYSYYGERQSKFILWHENGEMAFSGYYDKKTLYSDKTSQPFNGNIIVLLKNGQKARECYYDNGQAIGIETEWYGNGNKRTRINHISITQTDINKWKIRTDINNWDTNGEPIGSGKMTYEGNSQYYSPFSLERANFLTYSLIGNRIDQTISNLKKELANKNK